MRKTNQNGFSLLELVIAVGIILLLTAAGTVGYNLYTENAKKAATQRAASEVLTAAIIYDQDPTGVNHPIDAVTEWENSASDDSIELQLGMTSNSHNGRVTRCVQVTATHEDGYSVTKSGGDTGCEGESSTGPEEEDDFWVTPDTATLSAEILMMGDFYDINGGYEPNGQHLITVDVYRNTGEHIDTVTGQTYVGHDSEFYFEFTDYSPQFVVDPDGTLGEHDQHLYDFVVTVGEGTHAQTFSFPITWISNKMFAEPNATNPHVEVGKWYVADSVEGGDHGGSVDD